MITQFVRRTRLTSGRVHFLTVTVALLFSRGVTVAQEGREFPTLNSYFNLGTPRRILPKHQRWEEDQFPHTLSVVEVNRGGYRYWGWYGLNDGGGIGLARSNDLV